MIKCDLCSASNTDDSRFCRNCGSPLQASYTCGQCGGHNRQGSRFCTNCGAALEPGVPARAESAVAVEEEVSRGSTFPWKGVLIGAAGAALIMAVALAVMLLRKPQEQVALGGSASSTSSLSRPTYQGAIKAILDEKCVFCHSANGLAPQTKTGIPLRMEGYRGAFLLRNMIMDEVVSRRMPLTYNHDKKTFEKTDPLSPDEIQTIISWVRNGAPEN